MGTEGVVDEHRALRFYSPGILGTIRGSLKV
jgi:hypothetical protein